MFECLLAYENYPQMQSLAEADAGTSTPEQLQMSTDSVEVIERTNYPLTFTALMRDRIGTRMIYDTRAYDPEMINQLLAHFTNILALIAEGGTGKSFLVSRWLAELKDKGQATSEQICLAKYANVESAQEIARSARELLGGVGILDDFAAMRHMCNLESVATYEGTRDVHRLVLGRWLTGLQAFR